MKLLIIFLLSFSPTLVIAEVAKTSSSPITTDYMAKLLLSLGLVVVIIFALAWLVKRFNFIPQQNQGIIKVISTLSVGSRDRLALIQVGDEQLLIALTPGKISKLHSMENPVESINQSQSSFKNKFNAILEKQTNNASKDEKNDD